MIRTINLSLPRSWDELSDKQLLFVSKLFILNFHSDPYTFLTHVLVKFANIRIRSIIKNGILYDDYIIKVKNEKRFKLSTSQFHTAANSLSFLLEPVINVNTLKSIRRCKPCHKRMYDTKFIQFLTAENYFLAFASTKEPKYLRYLAATAYNFEHKPFDDKLTQKRSRRFLLTSYFKLYAVYLWYAGFRSYLAIEFPYVFSISDNSQDASDSQPKAKEYLMSLIRGLTDGDVTKNDLIQYDVNTMDALFELNQKSKSIQELNKN